MEITRCFLKTTGSQSSPEGAWHGHQRWVDLPWVVSIHSQATPKADWAAWSPSPAARSKSWLGHERLLSPRAPAALQHHHAALKASPLRSPWTPHIPGGRDWISLIFAPTRSWCSNTFRPQNLLNKEPPCDLHCDHCLLKPWG